MRRVLAASAIVLLLPIAGHASQLAFTLEPDSRIPRGFGLLDLPIREVATVYVDGVPLGDTLSIRGRGILLSPGRHQIVVRALAETSCAPLVGIAIVEAGSRTSTLALDDGSIVGADGGLYLRECETEIRVLAPPFASANVMVDGERVGRTGETILVPSGAHRFEVEAFEAGPQPRRWRFEAVLEIQTSPDVIEFWIPLRPD